MVVCERCGSGFHSARAAKLDLCPRCLLRDDAAARLVPLRPSQRRASSQRSGGSDAANRPEAESAGLPRVDAAG